MKQAIITLFGFMLFGVADEVLAHPGSGIVVDRQGNVYPWLSGGKQFQIFRLSAAGTTTTLKTLPANTESGPLQWLNGMALGPDGSLYYTENKAIRRITPKGEITTFIDHVTLTGCDSVPEVGGGLGAYFPGLDVDADRSVYVAATVAAIDRR